uniref:hypothetical protein n=1 Tax=uncultured Methanosphaera sp. TaxID=262501 RepID=UPI00280BD277
LFIINIILSMLHMDTIIKYILICIILYIVNKKVPKKHTKIMTITTLIVIITITPQLLKSYIITFLILEFITTFIYIMKHRLLDVILTKNYTINNLSEGMLLAQPLINTQHKYTFNNNYESGNIVLKNNIYGLEEKDITLLKKLEDENYITHVPIKKTICFAPFIQVGVILTILFGNIITTIIGAIL